MLIRKFRKCSEDVKIQLFKTYLCNLYCPHLWKTYSNASMKSISVAFNNVFRSIINIKGKCSIREKYVLLGLDSFNVLKRKSINFRKRLMSSQNVYVFCIVNSLFFLTDSKTSLEWKNECF